MERFKSVTAVVLTLIGLSSSTTHAAEKSTTQYTSQTNCRAQSDWFNSPVKPPKEGKDSPFAFKKGKDQSTNCDFHQWSWQKFLYLTQIDKKTNQLVMFGYDYLQVNNEMMPYLEPWNDLLNPTGFKLSSQLILEDTTQAGSSHGELFTKYGNQPAYYSIHINREFIKSAAKTPITSSDQFAVGSVEIKAAWLAIDQLRALYSEQEIDAQFYTRQALIKADNKTMRSSKVALIGMHVVGVVENHPEFIWATFEHQASTPDYYGSTSAFKKVTTAYDVNKVVSDSDNFIFYRKNTTAGDANLSYPQGETTTNTFRLYQFGVPNGAPYTTVATATQQNQDAENFNNIQQLNHSVQQALAAQTSPWQHYFYAGSVWLSTLDYQFSSGISGNIVPPNANDKLRGSLALANITMETYTQTYGDPNQTANYSINNCFACHGITAGKSTMAVSHIFNNFEKLRSTNKQLNVQSAQ
ncbi:MULTISPECIES: hypothetical protein [Pseudoalteromonas]|uniref:Cytochrome c family protein n=1 Tax=Pseudoalteromonas rhizosphaerae TaxID=2518973 RepID=A0ABW8L3Z0_9GAMM|nr:hypothetical protein [Pseudoalteromonas sp. SG44-1]MBB1418809.1 hypothetical protein [Pseudoalteromonas sp. SG44-1]